MKSYHLQKRGSIEGLLCREGATPPLGPDEVRLRMRATSLNYRDILIMLDLVPLGGTIDDVIPLSDGAGEILEIGTDVRHLRVGDKIVCAFNPSWIDGPAMSGYLDVALGGQLHGLLAQEAVVKACGVLPMPDHLSFEEAAALGCASTTAWSSLVGGRQPLIAGQTLLIQGTGGVSIFALQYAKAMGARVIATTSSAEKAERLRSLGADAVINYVENPNWHLAARDLTGGKGVDRVVEVGGPGTLERSTAATAIGGHISIVGFVGGTEGGLSALSLLGNALILEGITVGSVRNFRDSLRATSVGGIKPVVGKIFAFNEALQAYQYMMDRHHFGKVVIKID